MAALETVGKLQQNIAENRNWNASKKNPLALVQTNTVFNLISASDAEYKEDEKLGEESQMAKLRAIFDDQEDGDEDIIGMD